MVEQTRKPSISTSLFKWLFRVTSVFFVVCGLLWYTKEPSQSFLQFLLEIWYAVAFFTFWLLQLVSNLLFIGTIPFIQVYEIVTNKSVTENLLVGREKLKRIALWYTAMAVTGFAGFWGFYFYPGQHGESPTWISPAPALPIYYLALILNNFYLKIHLSYLTWTLAMLAYIAITGPLLQLREISRLPRRCIFVLGVYTFSSCVWLVAAAAATTREWSDIDLILPLILNVIAITVLWAWQFARRGHWNADRIIAWNAALIGWLFWIAHPMIVFQTKPPF